MTNLDFMLWLMSVAMLFCLGMILHLSLHTSAQIKGIVIMVIAACLIFISLAYRFSWWFLLLSFLTVALAIYMTVRE